MGFGKAILFAQNVETIVGQSLRQHLGVFDDLQGVIMSKLPHLGQRAAQRRDPVQMVV